MFVVKFIASILIMYDELILNERIPVRDLKTHYCVPYSFQED